MTSEELYPEGYWERAEGSNYRGYGDDPGWSETARVMYNYLGAGQTLLECGAASGYFLRQALKVWPNSAGFDLSKYIVGQAPAEVEGHLFEGDATRVKELVKGDNAPTVICSWEMLEHLHEAEIDQFLTDTAEMLPIGGTMWHRIALETEGDPDFDFIPDHHPHDDETHVTIKSKDWWRNKFDLLGLEQCNHEEDSLSLAFRGRDWENRFFVYRKTEQIS